VRGSAVRGGVRGGGCTREGCEASPTVNPNPKHCDALLTPQGGLRVPLRGSPSRALLPGPAGPPEEP